MTISLHDLVTHSDYKKYYFIIDAKEVERGVRLSYDIKFSRQVTGTFTFEFCKPSVTELGWEYYDLGRCCNLVTKTANNIAWYIEKTKAFAFKAMQHDGDTLYIYLTIK